MLGLLSRFGSFDLPLPLALQLEVDVGLAGRAIRALSLRIRLFLLLREMVVPVIIFAFIWAQSLFQLRYLHAIPAVYGVIDFYWAIVYQPPACGANLVLFAIFLWYLAA